MGIYALPMLRVAADCDPFEKALQPRTLAPQQRKEFSGVEIRGLVPEKSFQAPLDVRRLPGARAVALGDNPVIAQCIQHGGSENGKEKVENGNRVQRCGRCEIGKGKMENGKQAETENGKGKMENGNPDGKGEERFFVRRGLRMTAAEVLAHTRRGEAWSADDRIGERMGRR